MFGGWGRAGCQTKELIEDKTAHSIQVLDTTTMAWCVPRRQATKQVHHLYNHSASRAGPTAVIIFGGFDGRQACFDLATITLDSQEAKED